MLKGRSKTGRTLKCNSKTAEMPSGEEVIIYLCLGQSAGTWRPPWRSAGRCGELGRNKGYREELGLQFGPAGKSPM